VNPQPKLRSSSQSYPYVRRITASWVDSAACRGHAHPEWWDEKVAGETLIQRQERHGRAKAICETCPVTAECRAAAIPNVDGGIRGGENLPPIKRTTELFVPLSREHGTPRGYYQHRNRKEMPACEPCMAANRERERERRAETKRKAA
jgi:hypothetical protein